MAGRRSLFLTLWLGALVFYIAYREWLSWLLLVTVAALPFFSLLLSLPFMLLTRVRIDIPTAVTVGRQQDLSMLYWCPVAAPPWWCRLTVRRPLTGEQWTLREAEDLPTDHCGALICSVRKGRVMDYLGLFKLPLRRCPEQMILVRPVPIPIPDLPSPEEKLHRAWRPKPGGGFAENHELRLYRPGDSIHQIHWKLSAKTGRVILREPMEPVRGRLLVRLDLSGSPSELDRKLGQLLWLGDHLIGKDLPFELQCLTGAGIRTTPVAGYDQLHRIIDTLLRTPRAQSGSLRDRPESAMWQYFIGGAADEA